MSPVLSTGFTTDWQFLRRRNGQCVDLASIVAQELKPFPPATLFASGYTNVFDHQDIIKDRAKLCFHALSKDCWRPANRARQTSAAAAIDPFFQDHRRFLVLACEEAGLVWKQEEWRQLDREERAVL